MINTDAIKTKIISFLERNGPSIPMQIAKEINMNSIFTSAFLSELLDAKKIKTSSVRVGGTSLYLLPGQEVNLEKFHNNLHPKEVEAYEKLKQNKILKDIEQDPAIRVALRNIKDFAFSFKNDEELYWRYLTTSEEEIRNLFSKKEPKIEEKIEPKIEEKTLEVKTDEKEIENKVKSANLEQSQKENTVKNIEEEKVKEEKDLIENPIKEKLIDKKIKQKPEQTHLFENPLAIKIEPKVEKIKPKSEFVLNVIDFLEKNDFKILEEKEYSKKEYNCIAEFKTKLGPIAFLTQAKEKKSISESDLDPLLRQAQSIPLPALMLYPDSLSKKAVEYQNQFYSILKTLKID